MKKLSLIALAVVAVMVFGMVAMFHQPVHVSAQSAGSAESRVGGFFVASQYGQWTDKIVSAPAAVGAGTITLASGTVTLPDGRVITPFSTSAPITIADGNSETVTPTAVSGCTFGALPNTCQITATFSNLHGQGSLVTSGSFGLNEAILDANSFGGGTVVADQSWFASGGTKTIITNVTAATPKVWVLDNSLGSPDWFGKSGTTNAAYSNSNNDMFFTVTLAGNTATKTLSQTYAAAPICTATDQTTAQLVKSAPTTSTVVISDTVGATDVVAVHCTLLSR